MLVLALDTTTRPGSVALARDGAIVDACAGDPGLALAQRLPGDLVRVLDRQRLRVGEIDLFAVAIGPGSFTGLRIGIATMQGLALANDKNIVGISALDALYHASLLPLAPNPLPPTRDSSSRDLAVWIDAQRGEVFAALYRDGVAVDGPTVGTPIDVLSRWLGRFPQSEPPAEFIGDGAVAYAEVIHRSIPDARIATEVPLLAPSVALLAVGEASAAGGIRPDAIRPLYVRRPDVELARDRKAAR